jgi:P pilus assembly chaperone PapD
VRIPFTAFCAASVLALGALSGASPVRAGMGIDVSPAKLEISMPAGAVYNMPILVRNEQAQSVHIQASEVDFSVDPSGNYAFDAPGTSKHSLMKWASINPREFDLPPGTSQQVRVTFNVPSGGTLSGEYAGIVFFQTRPERRRGAVSLSARVATKIYQTFPNTEKLGGAIDKMSVAMSSSQELYRVEFRNTGNAHVYLKGRLEVRKGADVVEKLPIDGQPLVERGGTRLLEIPGKKLDPGAYDVVAIIDYGGTSLTGGQLHVDAH